MAVILQKNPDFRPLNPKYFDSYIYSLMLNDIKKIRKLNSRDLVKIWILFMATTASTYNFEILDGAGDVFAGSFVCMIQGIPQSTTIPKMMLY